MATDTESAEADQLEAEHGLTIDSSEVYPDAVIKISRDQYSAFEIKRMAEETRELVLAPDFQRNKVWKTEQKHELIESLLMGIPIPVIYVFENEQGVKQMVDGRQRVSTIIDFMNNRFALSKLGLLHQFNGARFEDLPPLYRSKLERYQLSVYVIEPPTPERVKYDIFDRVNRGGTQLNNQEMRNALYYGESTRLLQALSQLPSFLQATGGSIQPQRMRDQYVILRFLAFYLLRQGYIEFAYKSNLEELLAAVMQYLNTAEPDFLQALRDVFDLAMQRAFACLGEDAFRFAKINTHRRPINMALFECLSYGFAIFPDMQDWEEVAIKVNEMKQKFDEGDSFRKSVDGTSSVEYRFSQIEQLRDDLAC